MGKGLYYKTFNGCNCCRIAISESVCCCHSNLVYYIKAGAYHSGDPVCQELALYCNTWKVVLRSGRLRSYSYSINNNWTLALNANIRLRCKWMTVASTQSLSNFIKLFMDVIYEFSWLARVFGPGTHFQLSLLFVAVARSLQQPYMWQGGLIYTYSRAPERYFNKVGSCFANKH